MRIALLGGGGIGCCVAGSLYESGVDITVIGVATPANDAVVRRLDTLGVRFTPELSNLSGSLDEVNSTHNDSRRSVPA